MLKRFLKRFVSGTWYRPGVVRKILAGPCKGLRYRIFPEYGLSPILGGWEADAQALMVKYIGPEWVVYDIGANYGIHTLLMARLAYSGCVYAFEPIPQILSALRENVSLNRFDNVICVPLAISDRVGSCSFVAGHHRGAGHLIDNSVVEENAITVKTITLDKFVFDEGHDKPNLIKIDVEGAESRVLLGAAQILREARPILLVDLHTPDQDVAVGQILQKNNYSAYRVPGGERVQNLEKGWPHLTGLWGQFIALPL